MKRYIKSTTYDEFSNYPSDFKFKGLDELKEFVGSRSDLYSLISKLNPIAIIDRRNATVKIDGETYLLIMQKVKYGQRLKLIWKVSDDNGRSGGQYYIQDNKFVY